MPRRIALKENGRVVGRLTVPDEATDEQIRAAMVRLKEHREKTRVETPTARDAKPAGDPMDQEIRCIACRGRVIVKRRDLEEHMAIHRKELEDIATGRATRHADESA